MSNRKSATGGIIAVIIVTILVFAGLLAIYLYNDGFHGIFVNNPRSFESIVGEVPEDSGRSIAAHREMIGYMVFGIFSAVICLQIVVFGTALLVTRGITSSEGDPALKLRKLENAGIFFDLPLYTGLFGTVASFMVITLSRESSLLIAYSTTLLGIIFSVVLHVSVLYPARRRLLNLVK